MNWSHEEAVSAHFANEDGAGGRFDIVYTGVGPEPFGVLDGGMERGWFKTIETAREHAKRLAYLYDLAEKERKQGTARRMVAELRPGDMVDLEGDLYADPEWSDPGFPHEFATVIGIEREAPDCVRVDFDGGAFGFPPSHMVPAAPCPTVAVASPREFSAAELDLAASLACYCSADDWGTDRITFLRAVVERITLDLPSP